ncbi:MAG: prenyltransferase [Actinobacteria bacterium]|nr:prenyltransferase [Actinomycetota bacterium]
MTTLTTREAVTRARGYRQAVLSWVGADGYPMSVSGSFRTDATAGTVVVGPLPTSSRPPAGQEVCVTFSHIRPQRGVGYDERRYINLWGPATHDGGSVRVVADRASGWDEAEVPFFEYAERNVPRARSYMENLGAQLRLSPFWKFFLATRLPFLTATIIPVSLGGAVAASHGSFHWGWFLLTLLGAASVHLGLNMANDLFDDINGADAANVTPTPFSGGSRVLQYGLVSRRGMLGACVGFYLFAAAIGLLLAATRTWSILWVGVVGVVLSLVYSAPPFRLVHRGLGEPVTALGFGPVMAVGAYLAVAQEWNWEPVLASIPVAIFVALILYVNQVPDRIGDAVVGKRTLIVRWPKARVIAVYTGLAAIAFVVIGVNALTSVSPIWTLAALVTVPLALRVRRGLVKHYDQPYALMPAMQDNIVLHLTSGLLLIIGYVVHNLLA